jgi:hypothetical protein
MLSQPDDLAVALEIRIDYKELPRSRYELVGRTQSLIVTVAAIIPNLFNPLSRVAQIGQRQRTGHASG